MLGLFDSGLGGLTVLRRLNLLLPRYDLLFFADQANVPYGDRSPSELRKLLEHNVQRLDEARVDAIVMACNTSCATAAQYGWPKSRALILDLIDSAALAIERAAVSRIAIVATAATAKSRAYTARIASRMRAAHVTEIAAPRLVPLIEAGKLEGPEPRSAVEEVCSMMPRDVEAVVLACTHYPLLEREFRNALGSEIVLIDPAIAHAERAALLAREHGYPEGSGTIRCMTSGDAAAFEAAVAKLIPRQYETGRKTARR